MKFNEDLIQKLQNRQIAIDFRPITFIGSFSEELSTLTEVVKRAFPNNPPPTGVATFYFATSPSYKTWGSSDNPGSVLGLDLHNVSDFISSDKHEKETFSVGEEVLVWDGNDESNYKRRYYVATNEAAEYPFLVTDKNIISIKGTFCVSRWKYIAKIPQSIELTAQDISDGKGVGIDPKLIKFVEHK